jgi:hypothetical protein
MIPELYRSFETSTLKDLVSYGEAAQEEPWTEEWERGDDEGPSRQTTLGDDRRPRSWRTRRKGRWLRLGRRLIARAELR